MEIRLQGRVIPRDEDGDPAFTCLEYVEEVSLPEDQAVLTTFTPAEVVEIVNRWVYSQTYQKDYHRKAQRKKLDFAKALNAKLREMFGRTSAKCTDAEIKQAMDAIIAEGKEDRK